MPLYLFSNPEDETEVREVVMSVNDSHEYSVGGVKWDRVWTKPQMSVDSTIDPNSTRDFVEKTGRKRGTLGDIQDLSQELSEKREKQRGVDPLKIAANEKYKKSRRGRELPEFRKKKLKENLKKTMFEWSDL
jgi:hypothetical protein